jgi:hypothetical protein
MCGFFCRFLGISSSSMSSAVLSDSFLFRILWLGPSGASDVPAVLSAFDCDVLHGLLPAASPLHCILGTWISMPSVTAGGVLGNMRK